jgi:hypothetical protein
MAPKRCPESIWQSLSDGLGLEGMSQMIESLPSKLKAVSSNPETAKKKKASVCCLIPGCTDE